MKLRLRLTYNTNEFEDFKEKQVQANTNDWFSDYEIMFREVVVDIPDDFQLTEKQYKDALYLKKLNKAENRVEEKKKELHQAEEVVKNMLALPAEIVD